MVQKKLNKEVVVYKRNLCTKGIYELQYQRIHSRYVIYSFFYSYINKVVY